jgi:Integrase zinc binding domain
MSEMHDKLTEAAHAGYHKTYNRITSVYYWPRMSRHIKQFVTSCDICQKAKPRRHAPMGLLQPLPIPERPFEVVSMDFITELPSSQGYDNILVVVDKLTKYAIFIPTTSSVNEEQTAKLFFDHVATTFGLP